MTEGDYEEPKTVYEAMKVDDWDQWHRAMKDEVKALQNNETWNLVRPPTEKDVIPGKWVYVKLGVSRQIQSTMWQNVSNKWKGCSTLRPLCLPVSWRHSGFYFNYKRRRAM